MISALKQQFLSGSFDLHSCSTDHICSLSALPEQFYFQSHDIVAHTPTLRSGLLHDCFCCLLMQLYDQLTSHKLIFRGKSPCSMFGFYPPIKPFPFTN